MRLFISMPWMAAVCLVGSFLGVMATCEAGLVTTYTASGGPTGGLIGATGFISQKWSITGTADLDDLQAGQSVPGGTGDRVKLTNPILMLEGFGSYNITDDVFVFSRFSGASGLVGVFAPSQADSGIRIDTTSSTDLSMSQVVNGLTSFFAGSGLNTSGGLFTASSTSNAGSLSIQNASGVPEPASFAFAGVAVAGMSWYRRRKGLRAKSRSER